MVTFPEFYAAAKQAIAKELSDVEVEHVNGLKPKGNRGHEHSKKRKSGGRK